MFNHENGKNGKSIATDAARLNNYLYSVAVVQLPYK